MSRFSAALHFSNEIPHFGTDRSPDDYGSILRSQHLEKHSDFEELSQYAHTNDRLKEYFLLDDPKLREIGEEQLLWLPPDIADRYIHTYQTFEFVEEYFRRVYWEFETGIYLRDLPVNIMIPILFVKSDIVESVEIYPHVTLERMDEKLQLARMQPLVRAYLTTTHPIVAGAATHCLTLDDWSIPNKEIFSSVSGASPEVLRYVDNFFCCSENIQKHKHWIRTNCIKSDWLE